MSSQAYYLAQIAIIIAAAMVVLSAAGFDLFGDQLSTGIAIGALGLLMIVWSVIWVSRRANRRASK